MIEQLVINWSAQFFSRSKPLNNAAIESLFDALPATVENAGKPIEVLAFTSLIRQPPGPHRCAADERSCLPGRGCQTWRRMGSPSCCSAFVTEAIRCAPRTSSLASRGRRAIPESSCSAMRKET
jgi:hypothetical protein